MQEEEFGHDGEEEDEDEEEDEGVFKVFYQLQDVRNKEANEDMKGWPKGDNKCFRCINHNHPKDLYTGYTFFYKLQNLFSQCCQPFL